MGLMDALEAKDKKGLFKSNDSFASYGTGILPLDFANGFLYTVPQPDGTSQTTPIVGVMGGTFITIIGLSGSGKTTLADQIAWSIIKDFDDGLLFHYDIEKTALKTRICEICGADMDDPRIRLIKDHVAIEDVLEMLEKICAEKEAGGDIYKYDLPKYLWRHGKPEKAYVPTVMILDSLPAFNSRERKEGELEGQMSGGREASQISQFYTKCLNSMSKYNITIIAVNHIKSKVDINPYQSSAPQLMMLKQGESLPRGVAPIYYAQNIFRCNATKGNIYTLEDNGFEGFMCTLQVAKSKTSFIGSTVNICFNKDIGFDPIYTMYEFAKQAGLIQGKNPNLYIQGADTFKFNRKHFREKFIKEPEFRNAYMKILDPYLHALLGSKTMTEKEKDKYIPIDALLVEAENGSTTYAAVDEKTGDVKPIGEE